MSKNKHILPLAVIAFLYFLFGFITTMNNSTIEFLKSAFGLNDVQKLLPNTFFFAAYGLSIPIGLLSKRIGYRYTLYLGVALIALGFFAAVPALNFGYYAYLSTIFVFATGAATIQVAGSPYTVALGSPESAASRLSLTNGLNSVATVFAPIFVSIFIVTPELGIGETLDNNSVKDIISKPYIGIGIATVLVLAILPFIKLPNIKQQLEQEEAQSSTKHKSSAFKYKHVWLGALAAFAYLGLEIGIPSFFADFAQHKGAIIKTSPTDMLKYYWGGLMVGRFIGIFLLKRVKPTQLLVFSTLGATLMLLSAVFLTGNVSMWLYLGTGLFHSIMWPVIYSLALSDLGPHTDVASGIIASSVIGAAILTPLMGMLQNITGTVIAAVSCVFVYYAYIAFFGLKGAKIRN